MSRGEAFYSPVNHCARCGKDHRELKFHKFKQPIVDEDGTVWEYWTICPRTGDPVLLRTIKKEKLEEAGSK